MPASRPEDPVALRAELEALRAELRVSREAATITAELVVAQFEATERLLSRVQFAQAEREAIFNAASKVALIATRLDGQITLFSRGAERLLGYRAGEVVNKKSLLNFHLPDEVELLSAETGREITRWDEFVEAIRLGGDDQGEWNYLRKDGSTVPVSLSISVLRDDEDRVTGYVGAAIDISTSRRTEAELHLRQDALAEAERRLRDIINLLPDATMVIDTQGRVTFWNKSMERMTGVPASEMIGKGDYEYALPFYGKRRPILIDLVLKPDAFSPSVYQQVEILDDSMWGESTIESLRGRAVHLRGSAAVLRDINGKIVGAIETIFDITERSLLIEELRRAKEEAETTSNAKSVFLANMSHELRTPLNSIIGFSEFVSSQAFGAVGDPQYVEHAQYALDSARHLLEMVNSILDMSKIDAGMMQLEPGKVNIASVLRRCARVVNELARQHGVTIKVAVPLNVPDILADERALRQIMINLLGNAIKFNVTKGSILMTALESGSHVEIVVADTGSGIPPDALDRVRKPFEQIDNKYGRAHGGTGLGLSIVEGLVKLHGGTLEIASEVGKGTAVIIRLPKQLF